jgi:reactive intermediate/imine deaminase
MKQIGPVVVLSSFVAAHAFAQTPRTYYDARRPADASLPPFSQAVLVGNTLYLSGMIGLLPDRTVPSDAEAEARLVLDTVKAALVKAGLTMDDLATVTIYCSDVKHYDVFNKVYRTYFTKEFPARAFIGAGTLLFGARFELQGIAIKR